ncbi:MAG: N-acetylmuramoyl-L-alanine amidase [Nocardioidaceae bacterium]
MSSISRRRLLTAVGATSTFALTGLGLAVGVAPTQAAPPPTSTGQACLSGIRPGSADSLRQRVFDAASRTFGVPLAVVQGVSYLESRWDAHGSSPSTAGGYGPMHLTDVTPPDMSRAKGIGGPLRSDGPAALHTADRAASLTGLPAQRVKADAAANICAGTALLASYQRQSGAATGVHTDPAQWYGAVRSYSGSASAIDSATFARRVLTVIGTGAARTTNDGQRVRLQAVPGLRAPAAPVGSQTAPVDCPTDLNCEWVPAPYEWYGRPDPYAYGNHDLANRPESPEIDYIVIHDTETSYQTTLDLVQDPTYVSWNYTIRSSDGHVAQHLYANNVGWHAGNWYVNTHSIGIEHEGFAAQGATWYTESMYESSAELVGYLAKEYGVRLDRAHIIGHDQVPGILPKYVRGMHWDPGPYWDWGHYFALLGAPIGTGTRATPANVQTGTVVKVAPGFAGNQHKVTGCTEPGVRCPDQGTNFVYLRQGPRALAPLVKDVGIHRHGGSSTTDVADIGARAAAGQKLVVAGTYARWIAVWYLGQKGWIYVPPGHSPLVLSSGQVVTVRAGASQAPVYGRAYPERSAYPDGVPIQRTGPLQYTIEKGQRYVVADATVPTDYYYASTYDDSVPHDHTDIVGKDTYKEIWFGHRMAFVRTADVDVR